MSAVLYCGVLVINGFFVGHIYQHELYGVWFLPCLGLALLPVVVVQLVSAVLLLIHRGDKLTTASSVGLGLLHILQIGFVWRHVAIFREVEPKTRSQDLRHLSYLQLVWTFSSLLPLTFIQTLLILFYQQPDYLVATATVLTSFSTCYYLAAYRRPADDSDSQVMRCNVCESIFKVLWRLGEVISRVLCLAVFTTVYSYWIFLIIILHWITMLVCLCTAILDMFHEANFSKTRQTLSRIMVAYIYTFVFINFKSQGYSAFRYTFYYVVIFLENTVLVVVWYLHANEQTGNLDKHVILSVCAVTFFVGIISLIIYSKCFNKIALFDTETEHIYNSEECINCRLSMCSKHNLKMQRPFSAGWVTQYQKAAASGNYYKNILQDNFIDSDGNSSADILNSSGEHCQIRDTDLESIRTTQNKQTTVAVQASGTYTHKRFFNSNSSIAHITDSDSISSGSGVYEEDWRQKSVDTLFSQLSAIDALSMVSSRTQLLTDSWDSLMKDNKESCRNNSKHPKKFDILSSLIKKDLDTTSYCSDGYTTDHTLDSYQLPVTVLAKKRSDKYGRKRIESAYSTASDSTDCTICAFIRQNPSSPEENRKHYTSKITQEVPIYTAPKRKKRRDYSAGSSAASKSKRHNLSTDLSGSEHSFAHKYEKATSRNRRLKCDAIKVHSTSQQRTISETNYADRHRVILKPDLCPRSKQYQLNLDSEKLPKMSKLNAQISYPYTLENYNGATYSGKSVRETASDSGDSAFPRHTPVNQSTELTGARQTPLCAYLAATDDDKDGTSESSCEMII